jgi:hypothetical protein
MNLARANLARGRLARHPIRRRSSAVSHPLAVLFASRDGFLYDGFYESGDVDFALDAAGTIPCEAGGDVCLFVRDHSGLGHHLVQETSGNGLIYRVDANGKKSFVTGNLTSGGAQRYAQVTGVGALPDAYTDIIVFRGFSYFGIGQYENFFESCSMSGTGTFYGGSATDRTVLYGTTYRGAGQMYGGWGMQYNDTASAFGFVGGGSTASVFPYRNDPGLFLYENLPVATNRVDGRAIELPNTEFFYDKGQTVWTGASAFPNGGTRTLIGGDVSSDLVNMERVFRMRIYGELSNEEFDLITEYMNSVGITSWEGGAG